MSEQRNQAIDSTAVERHAESYYAELILEMEKRRQEVHAGGDPFDSERFTEFVHGMSQVRRDVEVPIEERVGFLIALTGCIHEYLEQEHGVVFSPR